MEGKQGTRVNGEKRGGEGGTQHLMRTYQLQNDYRRQGMKNRKSPVGKVGERLVEQKRARKAGSGAEGRHRKTGERRPPVQP